MNKKLEVIPKPKADSVTLLLPKKGETLPLIKFDGELNLVCGKCSEILFEGLIDRIDQSINVVVRCPVCRSYNKITMTTTSSES